MAPIQGHQFQHVPYRTLLFSTTWKRHSRTSASRLGGTTDGMFRTSKRVNMRVYSLYPLSPSRGHLARGVREHSRHRCGVHPLLSALLPSFRVIWYACFAITASLVGGRLTVRRAPPLACRRATHLTLDTHQLRAVIVRLAQLGGNTVHAAARTPRASYAFNSDRRLCYVCSSCQRGWQNSRYLVSKHRCFVLYRREWITPSALSYAS